MNKFLLLSFLGIFSLAQSAHSQPKSDNTPSEAQLVLEVINEKITILQKEIPQTEEKLKQSRKEYKKLSAKTPKGYIRMCGDSSSDSLEKRLIEYKADLKSLQNDKKIYESQIKKTKTEQGAAANP